VGIGSLEELNDRFMAWVERYLNVRVHSETRESPLARHARAVPRHPDPELLRQAFLWSAQRRVSRTGTVSFSGNEYQVDHALVGRRIDLRYRPEDLTTVEVWHEGRPHGHLTPLVIGRHVHPMAPPPPRPVMEPTGIDYLGQVLADHEEATTGSIAYRDLLDREEER
jgi:putative transposase